MMSKTSAINVGEPVISLTFRILNDNPLRNNTQEALNQGQQDNSGSIKLLLLKLEKSMIKEVKSYWGK